MPNLKLKLFQIDAFTNKLFAGNPAAVVPLKKWLPVKVLQNIALENNLSETAFYVKDGDKFRLRWFTPKQEVKLCGHATLATAYLLFNVLSYPKKEIHFLTKSGELVVRRSGKRLVLDFPAIASYPTKMTRDIWWLRRARPVEILRSKQDLLVLLPSESMVKKFSITLGEAESVKHRGLIVTAKGKDADFVSRCFYPELNVDEDPVTGSAHCQLTPYWSKKLGKKIMYARQLSMRGGNLVCEIKNDRVFLTGEAILYLVGEIDIHE